MKTIEVIADDYEINPRITKHDQMTGLTLYRIRARDPDGETHGFDFVPNRQQPRSTHRQQLDRMMLSLQEMAT